GDEKEKEQELLTRHFPHKAQSLGEIDLKRGPVFEDRMVYHRVHACGGKTRVKEKSQDEKDAENQQPDQYRDGRLVHRGGKGIRGFGVKRIHNRSDHPSRNQDEEQQADEGDDDGHDREDDSRDQRTDNIAEPQCQSVTAQQFKVVFHPFPSKITNCSGHNRVLSRQRLVPGPDLPGRDSCEAVSCTGGRWTAGTRKGRSKRQTEWSTIRRCPKSPERSHFLPSERQTE